MLGRVMRTLGLVILLLVALLGGGCVSRPDNSKVNLAPPVESTTVGPGDVFHMEIVGEKDLPKDYQVASDGTVDIPYIHRLKVEGLEPQEIARLVRQQLREQQILRDPSVIVTIQEYNSKRVIVLGQVQKPGSFPLTPGLTLLQAVSLAGGFNSIANRDRVNLTRRGKDGSRTVTLSAEAITDGESPDVPLQAGDQIYVNERIF